MRITIRTRKIGLRYCTPITAQHQRISRRLWDGRLMDAVERVRVTAQKGMGSIDGWAEMTRSRLIFAHIWYQYKLRYERVSTADFQAYIAMTTI